MAHFIIRISFKMYADLRGWDSAGEGASTGFALLLPSLAVQLAQLTPLQIHTHTCWFLWFTGTLHRRNGFYTVQTVFSIALHLNLALTGKVQINHILLVIPMSYLCHYTNLCPHKPNKHTRTHAHTHNISIKLNSCCVLKILLNKIIYLHFHII